MTEHPFASHARTCRACHSARSDAALCALGRLLLYTLTLDDLMRNQKEA